MVLMCLGEESSRASCWSQSAKLKCSAELVLMRPQASEMCNLLYPFCLILGLLGKLAVLNPPLWTSRPKTSDEWYYEGFVSHKRKQTPSPGGASSRSWLSFGGNLNLCMSHMCTSASTLVVEQLEDRDSLSSLQDNPPTVGRNNYAARNEKAQVKWEKVSSGLLGEMSSPQTRKYTNWGQ